MRPSSFRNSLACCLILASVGCATRTRFATHPKASAEFAAGQSDENAVEIADAVIEALGGKAAWSRAKQIKWKQEVKKEGATALAGLHAWDRWNGRHYARVLSGTPVEVMYPLYEEGGVAMVGNKRLDAASKNRAIEEARKRWAQDTALLLMPFLLESPGARLTYEGEVSGASGVDTSCHDLKVVFDKADATRPKTAYHLVVDKNSHLPVRLEIERGQAGNVLAYSFEEWTEVDGLKFAKRRQNLGYKAETIHFSEIEVTDEPDESLFTPQVR